MADRAFGVREINIVGSAGTPTISSPNNINLNGNNVAISTDLQVGRNVSVVGVVTANVFYGDGSQLTGIAATGGGGGSIAGIDTAGTSTFNNLNVSGMTTLGTNVNIGDGASYLQIYNQGQNIFRPNGQIVIQAGGGSGPYMRLNNNTSIQLVPTANYGVILYYGSSEKFTTNNTGVSITGQCSATTFVGDGSGLTNLPGGGGGSIAGIDTVGTSFFNTLHATGTIDIGTTNAGVAVTHMTIDTADVSGTIRNSIKSGAGNTNAVFDIETKEFLVTDPYAGKGALIAADSSGTKLFKDDSLKLQTIGTGVTVTGTMYATAFSGDGSGLTGVPISGSSGSFVRVDSQELVVSGLSTFQGNVYLGDNDVLNIGDTNDLQIWHTGSASVIRDSGTGELQIQSNGTAIRFSDTSGNKSALFNTNADANLYYADSLKLQTTGYGVTVSGTLQTQDAVISGVTTVLSSSASPFYIGDQTDSNGAYWRFISNQLSNYYIAGADLRAISELRIGHSSNFQRAATFDITNKRLGINTESATHTLTVNGESYLKNGLTVVGVVSATSNLHVANNLKLEGDGTDSFIKETSATGELTISTNQLKIENSSFETLARFNENADVKLYYDNAEKFNTTPQGVNVSGIATATSFNTNSTTGDGSDRGFTTKYYITADGSSSYRFAGPGVANTTANPTLYLHRGFTYILENSTGSGHPFELRVTSGGAAWAPGNFLSGSINGTQVLTVPFDAQASIVYQCTLHSGMVGTINFVS